MGVRGAAPITCKMKVKVFTLLFNPDNVGFNDEEVQSFIDDKEVLSVNDQFFIHENHPYLMLIVTYREVNNDFGRKRYPVDKKKIKEWRTILDDKEKTVYDALKKWRAERSKLEAVPLFIICKNQQMAFIAREKPLSLEALKKIDGIGEKKAKQYGEAILKIVKAHVQIPDMTEKEPENKSKPSRQEIHDGP